VLRSEYSRGARPYVLGRASGAVATQSWPEEIDRKILRWVDLVSLESGDADISENVASIGKRPVNSHAGLQKMRRAAFARRS